MLRRFDLLSADIESTQTLNVDDIIKGLAQYFSPVNLPFKKSAMRREMKNHGC